MASVLWLARRSLEHPWVALGLVVAAFVFTAAAAGLVRLAPKSMLRPGPVLVEVGLGAALLGADGWVYEPGHVFSAEQSLGVAWPIAGVLAAGVVGGPRAGTAAGLVLGAARAVSSIANTPPVPQGSTELVLGLTPAWTLALVSTTVLYVLAGAVAGYLSDLLRRAEREISAARAREEVARTLHDGVLQTLAVVERRTDDAELARLARDQERELRDWLFGTPGSGAVGRGELGDALRDAAGRFEERFGGRVQVLVPDDLPNLSSDVVEAVAGAVGEALTNAGKHGGADRVTVYVEPADGSVFCSVRDDGTGFDPRKTDEGVGLGRSIRGRITELGGEVEVDGGPGRGAEIRITVPART